MPPPTTSSKTMTTATNTNDWRDSYLVSLQEAERNSPVNRDLVAACSALADRVAALEAENAVLSLRAQAQPPPSQQQQISKPPQPPPGPSSPSRSTTSTPTPTTADPTSAAAGAQTRLDLAEALRSKGQLETRLRAAEGELKKLKNKSKGDEKRIRDLTAERGALMARLKDRSDELVEKNKMVNRFQDDIVALTMELNLTEQKNTRVAAENKELVDRWMKRMGEEADAMNLQNEPILNNKRR